jgi:hypothetical protein
MTPRGSKHKPPTKKRFIPSQLIVVDANVLRSASRAEAGPPPGAECRRALASILDICHRAVISPALEREYDEHDSRFGRVWRAAMTRKGKIVPTPAAETGRARGWMQTGSFTKEEEKAARKDLHLVLAAREQAAVILSRDDAARSLFARLPELAQLGWAQLTADDVEAWLRGGAQAPVVALAR